jgi:hypothetical protein
MSYGSFPSFFYLLFDQFLSINVKVGARAFDHALDIRLVLVNDPIAVVRLSRFGCRVGSHRVALDDSLRRAGEQLWWGLKSNS